VNGKNLYVSRLKTNAVQSSNSSSEMVEIFAVHKAVVQKSQTVVQNLKSSCRIPYFFLPTHNRQLESRSPQVSGKPSLSACYHMSGFRHLEPLWTPEVVCHFLIFCLAFSGILINIRCNRTSYCRMRIVTLRCIAVYCFAVYKKPISHAT